MCLSNNSADECFLLNEIVQFVCKKRESLHLSKIQGTIYSDDLGSKWNGA